jgi:hypothetical protein
MRFIPALTLALAAALLGGCAATQARPHRPLPPWPS